MGRRKDAEKTELKGKLGLNDSTKNWSKSELQDKFARQSEQELKDAEASAMTQLIAGDIPNVPSAKLEIPFDQKQIEDPFTGLTERQKMIARLRMRGLSQEAIANVVGVSQPIISKELIRIKTWQAERGRNVNQEEVVGNTASLYEEVEYRAWELYHSADEISDKAKSLAVVMQAREKHTKLLMDLGLIKKADITIKHKLEVSPFIEAWRDNSAKKSLGDAIVYKQLNSLADPTPDASSIEDAEVVEEEEPKVVVNDLDDLDLEEPTPEDLVLDLD